ncbi:hypothetical protein VTJ04DRAFT_6815 [Mycothermus thermophilus]|uniref:uncharacterized protein n=1 Tax=Humicola insolens TaxID=85995 RepID=UPI003744A2E4
MLPDGTSLQRLPGGQRQVLSPSRSPLATFIRWLLASSDPERQQLCSLLRNELADQLSQSEHPHAGDTMFLSFHAPFALLDAALDFNASRLDPEARLTQLYIAQAALSDLPAELQHDVATPAVLTVPTPSQSTPFPSKTSMENNGNQLVQGDIYTSSIWLGLTPTFTPWHRDPNPNLFCQLRGPKTVRLMPADPGTEVYSSVKSWVKARYIELRQALGGIPVSAGGVESPVPVLTNPAIRGIEMMQGVEKRVWEGVIWGEDAMSNGDDEEMLGPELEEATKLLGKLTKAKRLIEKHLVEAALMPGDVLYIPLGWWHSVRSGLPPVRRQAKQKDDDASSASGQEQQPGDLNASVNWWFRWRVSRQREW